MQTQSEATQMDPQSATVDSLSSFLRVASLLVDVDVSSLSMFFVFSLVGALFCYVVLYRSQGRLHRQVTSLSTQVQNYGIMLASVSGEIQELGGVMRALQDASASSLAFDSSQSHSGEPHSADTALHCIDAKLLDIASQTASLQRILGSLEAQQTIARLEEIQDMLQSTRVMSEQVLASAAALVPQVTAIQEKTTQIEPLMTGQQAMALDIKKNFASAETQSDGLLKQSQDTLKCVQQEAKELKDKLIKLETINDGISAACKQLSLDIHVSRTKQEQKMDAFLTDFKQFCGQTNSSLRELGSSIRGFGPLMPGMKALQESDANAIDYLATAFKVQERLEATLHNMQDQTNNIEDRLLRLESMIVGITDTSNESADVEQQLKESLNLLHDSVGTVLERLPKLPKRSPPSQDTAQTAPASSTTPPPQVAPQPAQPAQDTGIPLRLSEHLLPMQRSQEPIRFEIRSANQLQHIATEELLRALLSRQHFS